MSEPEIKQENNWNKKKWTIVEDKFLIDTVKKFEKKGKTKKEAFEYISKELNRTIGACSLRWNLYLNEEKRKMNKKKNNRSNKNLKSSMSKDHQSIDKDDAKELITKSINNLENQIEMLEEFIDNLKNTIMDLKLSELVFEEDNSGQHSFKISQEELQLIKSLAKKVL